MEAIAALGNLAVNDFNELEIVKEHALESLASSAALSADYLKQLRGRRDKESIHWEELAAQCSRCLRNLTVNPLNRSAVISSGVLPALKIFSQSNNDRIAQQSSKALRNLASARTSISTATPNGAGTSASASSGEDEAGAPKEKSSHK